MAKKFLTGVVENSLKDLDNRRGCLLAIVLATRSSLRPGGGGLYEVREPMKAGGRGSGESRLDAS